MIADTIMSASMEDISEPQGGIPQTILIFKKLMSSVNRLFEKDLVVTWKTSGIKVKRPPKNTQHSKKG